MRDEAIIRAIQRGDEGAIAGVITRYARLMWSVAGSVLRGVGSDQDVEECVADVFVYLWQHPDKFDPRRGSLRSWLAVVARSQAVDRCRALALGIPGKKVENALYRAKRKLRAIIAGHEKGGPCLSNLRRCAVYLLRHDRFVLYRPAPVHGEHDRPAGRRLL